MQKKYGVPTQITPYFYHTRGQQSLLIGFSMEDKKGSTGETDNHQVTSIKLAQTVRKEQGKVVLADRQAATQREICRPCCHV